MAARPSVLTVFNLNVQDIIFVLILKFHDYFVLSEHKSIMNRKIDCMRNIDKYPISTVVR